MISGVPVAWRLKPRLGDSEARLRGLPKPAGTASIHTSHPPL